MTIFSPYLELTKKRSGGFHCGSPSFFEFTQQHNVSSYKISRKAKAANFILNGFKMSIFVRNLILTQKCGSAYHRRYNYAKTGDLSKSGLKIAIFDVYYEFSMSQLLEVVIRIQRRR